MSLPRLALLLPLLLAGACARQERATPASAPATVAAADTVGGFSIYDLGSSWRDQRGAVRTLASLRGRPQALAMVYTHCTSTCPLIIGELKRIEAATTANIVLVSLDPERDTPGRLAGYAAEHDLDASRWTLLSGSDDEVRDLAAAIGVRYRRLSPSELAHSNTITLLDASGAVAHQQLTLAGTGETIHLAQRLAR